jgi:MinD-like ATPase involved in chromosome partitioning or flagellar assembly
VSENLKQEITSVIPFEERVIVSVNRGIPFLLVDKSRPISRAILSLAELVRKRIAELDTPVDDSVAIKGNGRK